MPDPNNAAQDDIALDNAVKVVTETLRECASDSDGRPWPELLLESAALIDQLYDASRGITNRDDEEATPEWLRERRLDLPQFSQPVGVNGMFVMFYYGMFDKVSDLGEVAGGDNTAYAVVSAGSTSIVVRQRALRIRCRTRGDVLALCRVLQVAEWHPEAEQAS